MWPFTSKKTKLAIITGALAVLGKKLATQENIEKVIAILNGQNGEPIAPWREKFVKLLRIIKPFIPQGRQIKASTLAENLNISGEDAQCVCDVLVQQKLIRPSHEKGMYITKGV